MPFYQKVGVVVAFVAEFADIFPRAGKHLILHLTGDPERELEEWTVQVKSELLRDEFDLDVVISPA